MPPWYPPSKHPGEAAYQLWKRAVVNIWMSNMPLNAYQCFIEERAALKLMATSCQRLLNKRAAQARMTTATQTFFLWLCPRRLHVQLARQTSLQQQHEATLAHL